MEAKGLFFSGVSLVAALFLVACGGSEEEAPSAESENGGAKPAQQQAAATSPKAPRKCPAKVTTGIRPDGAPVDDIVGIRPGMSFEDAEWVLACRDDVPIINVADKWTIKQNYDIPTRQLIRASDGVLCSGQDIARDMGSMGSSKTCDDGGYKFKPVKNSTQQIIVALNGMPGEEKVGAIWRRNAFPEGESPAIEALIKSLGEKYGPPHTSSKDRRGVTNLVWVYDLLNRPMSQSSRDWGNCANVSISASFAAAQRWSAGCGLTVKAAIAPVYGNELLAREMNMGVMHQKNFYEEGEQFMQALQAAHEARKQDEAAGAASAPDL